MANKFPLQGNGCSFVLHRGATRPGVTLVTRPVMHDKYQQFVFKDYVKSHPELHFCPEPIYQIIVQSSKIGPHGLLI
ncbi:hypothetical protein KR054_003542 [Drosophila jambulina]|nr:hypothetical protein KR054_003542 [Drosophila jambulina]